MVNSPKRSSVAVLLALGLATLPGCQAINDLLPPDPDRDTYSVTITPASLSLFIGEQSQLFATAYSQSGLVVTGKSATWSSTAPSVATVSNGGLVTAMGEGLAYIRVSIQGKTSEILISVMMPPQRLTVTATAGMPATITISEIGVPVTLKQCLVTVGQTMSCVLDLPARSQVIVMAAASGNTHSFVGWSGEGCTGTARCALIMDRPRTLQAAIAPRTNATLNLAIDGAFITQGTQRLYQPVDLVAGRDAYVRVWVMANQLNTVQPRVRIRLFHGSTEVQSTLVNAGTGSVGLMTNESASLTSTWNVAVPGALVIPGLRFTAEVDPENLIAEQIETDNRYPLDGSPLTVVARQLSPLQVRMVPIRQSVNGLLGEVDQTNVESFLVEARKLYPIGAYNVDIRATYTTNAPALTSTNTNGEWQTVLNEILALRATADQSTRYYFGVVKVPYTLGQIGIAMLPSGPEGTGSRAAVGVDHVLLRSRNMAHELGHNLGRKHAPCGAQEGLDEFYPDRGGATVSSGLDLTTLEVKLANAFDVMSYCHPYWVSWYTWERIFAWRLASPVAAPPALSASSGGDGLLVWGRIGSGRVILEPAFRTAPTGFRPDPHSAWQVEGRDATGALLFRHGFAPEAVADGGRDERQFAFVLPIGAADAERLASLRVSGPDGSAVQHARSGPIEPGDAPVARPLRPGVRRLTWDETRHPMALIRDAATGEILSFARGGAIDLWSSGRSFDLQLSDGVRTTTRRVAVQ